jgi:hypothetical protein
MLMHFIWVHVSQVKRDINYHKDKGRIQCFSLALQKASHQWKRTKPRRPLFSPLQKISAIYKYICSNRNTDVFLFQNLQAAHREGHKEALEQCLNLTLTWKSTEEDDHFADQLFLPVCIQYPHLAMKFSGMPA